MVSSRHSILVLVDMTELIIFVLYEVARLHSDFQKEKFGLSFNQIVFLRQNVGVANRSFLFVYAEQLDAFAAASVGQQHEGSKKVNIQEKHTKVKIQQDLMKRLDVLFMGLVGGKKK